MTIVSDRKMVASDFNRCDRALIMDGVFTILPFQEFVWLRQCWSVLVKICDNQGT